MQDARRFLARVVPWPEDDGTGLRGWVNLHYWYTNKYGRGGMRGRPFQTLDDAVAGAYKLTTDKNVTDIWYCTSLQQKCDMSKGFVTAAKSQEHAISLKALRADFDVKPGEPDKGYESKKEALADLSRFYKGAAIPPPNVIVNSGGGLHVYWVLDCKIAADTWTILSSRLKAAMKAFGVKADPTVTADSARVLRLPDTLNYKAGKQRPVEILLWDDKDYALADLEAALGAFKPEAEASVVKTFSALPASFAGARPPSLLQSMEFEKASEGCETESPVPDTKTVIRECGFLREAVLTGGKHYSEPLWDMSVLASVFLPEGVKLAHVMSKGHADYDANRTETKFNQKTAFTQKGGGWPSCSAIEGHGAPQCALCPHRGKVKGPLNLGLGQAVAAVVAPVAPAPLPNVPAAASLALPDGYVLDHEGRINKKGTKKDGTDEYERLFDSVLTSPSVHHDPPALTFTTNVGGKFGREEIVTITKAEIAGMELLAKLAQQDVSPNYQNKNASSDIKAFLMSWLTKCQQRKMAVAHRKLGWIPAAARPPGEPENIGFMYGGTYMHTDPAIPDVPVGYADPAIKEVYHPCGDSAPWHTAAKFVLEQGRTDLDVILASAFAGPLVQFTGEQGALINVWGTSGLGKSTAQKIAAAVWGHPNSSRLQVASTANHLGGKLRNVNSLPVYWDEIKTYKNMQELEQSCFTVTGGNEKGRMNRDLTLRRPGSWKTLLLSSSNKSFVDHLNKSMRETSAGVYRVLEFEAMNMVSDVSFWDVNKIVSDLDKNYGVIGIEYARTLTTLDPTLRNRLIYRGKKFDKAAGLVKEERFWSTMAAVILVGAEIARDELGVPFDVPRLEEFLTKACKDMKERVSDMDVDSASTVEGHMTTYFKTVFNSMLVTDTAWDIKNKGKAGKPNPNELKIFVHPTVFGKKGSVQIHWVKDQMLLRLGQESFEEWLAEKDITPSHIYKTLKVNGMVKHRSLTLASATPYSAGPERVIEIPIQPGSAWDTVLSSMAP